MLWLNLEAMTQQHGKVHVAIYIILYQFKTWFEAFKLVLLVQPSSASAEHVFLS